MGIGRTTEQLVADDAIMEDALRGTERVNGFLGRHLAILDDFERLSRQKPRRNLLSILDVCTAGCDVMRRVIEQARTRKLEVSATALELSPELARLAKRKYAGFPEVKIDVLDAQGLEGAAEGSASGPRLAYPPGSFDYVVCTGSLSAFSREEVVELLRQMHVIARRSFVLQDFRKSGVGARILKFVTRLLSHNPLVRERFDAALTNAYTQEAWRGMAQEAGINSLSVTRRWPFQLVLKADNPKVVWDSRHEPGKD